MLVTLDFETEAIDIRPYYPPRPVGIAMKINSKPGMYLHWGHGRVVDKAAEEEAIYVVQEFLVNPNNEFIFHNAPFDCAIIDEVWGIDIPWDRCHDTMLMAFLNDPYGELGLKPLAERLLGDPPTEQDAVRDWLVANGFASASSKSWGAHIARAPASIVGPYAIGDVDRTYKLYLYLSEKLKNRGLA